MWISTEKLEAFLDLFSPQILVQLFFASALGKLAALCV